MDNRPKDIIRISISAMAVSVGAMLVAFSVTDEVTEAAATIIATEEVMAETAQTAIVITKIASIQAAAAVNASIVAETAAAIAATEAAAAIAATEAAAATMTATTAAKNAALLINATTFQMVETAEVAKVAIAEASDAAEILKRKAVEIVMREYFGAVLLGAGGAYLGVALGKGISPKSN